VMQMKPWIIVVITEIRVKDVGLGLTLIPPSYAYYAIPRS
jgi:hypothetical protein